MDNIHNNGSGIVNGYPTLVHTQHAWIWINKLNNWTLIPFASPCPGSKMPINFLNQCSMIEEDKVVIITQNFDNFTTCTNILNLKTYQWSRVTSISSTTLPLGGFILTGMDHSRVYYLGGYKKNNSNNKTVYELSQETYQWTLTGIKLTIGMTNWDSIVLDSRLNLTQCMADKEHWPTT